jgi:hypothetical protein
MKCSSPSGFDYRKRGEKYQELIPQFPDVNKSVERERHDTFTLCVSSATGFPIPALPLRAFVRAGRPRSQSCRNGIVR